MANYFEMTRDELTAEKAALEEKYKKFQAMGLKLNMARGKPGPHQMDLAMDLLKMDNYITDNGFDTRNYGELEGLRKSLWAATPACRSCTTSSLWATASASPSLPVPGLR